MRFVILRHFTLAVPRILVVSIELEVFIGKRQIMDADGECRPAGFGTALAAAGYKLINHDAHGLTSGAMVAFGAIDVQTTAAETLIKQILVIGSIDRIGGGDHLRTRTLLRQIAACVFARFIQLQARKVLVVVGVQCVECIQWEVKKWLKVCVDWLKIKIQ